MGLIYLFSFYFHHSEKEKRKSQALILKIQREELSRQPNMNTIDPKENYTTNQQIEQNSPDFHGWSSIDIEYPFRHAHIANVPQDDLLTEFRHIFVQSCPVRDSRIIRNCGSTPGSSWRALHALPYLQ